MARQFGTASTLDRIESCPPTLMKDCYHIAAIRREVKRLVAIAAERAAQAEGPGTTPRL